MKAGTDQVKTIHVLKSKLRIDEASYRALLRSYGVSTSPDLQSSAARELIRLLVSRAQQAGVWNQKRKRWDNVGERAGMAVPAQLRKIEAMWAEVSRAPTAATKHSALRVFLENQFGVSALEWVTQEMVGKIIRTLQAMKHSKEKKDVNVENNAIGGPIAGADGEHGPDSICDGYVRPDNTQTHNSAV